MNDFKSFTHFNDTNLPFPDGSMIILCISGTASLYCKNEKLTVNASEIAFFPHMGEVDSVSTEVGFKGMLLTYASSVRNQLNLHSCHDEYTYIRLRARPVVGLSAEELALCKESIDNICRRIKDKGHLYHRQLIVALLTAHIFDLTNIYARQEPFALASSRGSEIMSSFLNILNSGAFIEHRNIGYYASILSITDGAFTKNIRTASGHSPSYWIRQALNREIYRLMSVKNLSLSDIAHKLNFGSSAHFSTYVRKNFGLAPSRLRAKLLSTARLRNQRGNPKGREAGSADVSWLREAAGVYGKAPSDALPPP